MARTFFVADGEHLPSVPTITPNTLTLVCSALNVPPLFTTDDATGRRSGYEPAAAAAIAVAAGLTLN